MAVVVKREGENVIVTNDSGSDTVRFDKSEWDAHLTQVRKKDGGGMRFDELEEKPSPYDTEGAERG